MKSVDVLIVVKNDEKTIPVFISEFNNLVPKGIDLNIIFLEDENSDSKVELLRDISKKLFSVNYISLDN